MKLWWWWWWNSVTYSHCSEQSARKLSNLMAVSQTRQPMWELHTTIILLPSILSALLHPSSPGTECNPSLQVVSIHWDSMPCGLRARLWKDQPKCQYMNLCFAESPPADRSGDSKRHGLHPWVWDRAWRPEAWQRPAEDPSHRPQGLHRQSLRLW